MNQTIIRFLQQQTCTTVCCIEKDRIPYCFNCYYVFEPDNALFYFKSSDNAYHTALLAVNPFVAGTILPDKRGKLMTKGIQWQGEMLESMHLLAENASAFYHKNIPMALAIKGKVFAIRLTRVKMTDSQLGFGKKIIWEREETPISADNKN